jgi:serine/threonine-protein kinase
MDAVARLNAALSGRYAIDREIGAGGMATVYLARDLRHNRRVALKVLNAELGAVLGTERFLSEIETTAKLQHPHLLPLFDSGEADGILFYVMPYVEGESLRARMAREKHLPVLDALRIATEVADALEYAHARGVIHRDIKPENILLHEGRALVTDFGIALAVQQAGGARLTETGLSLGTPQYMSPEQASGERELDRRSDVYSLACVLYEMLAGEPPFAAPTARAILSRVLTEDAKPVSERRRSVPPHVVAAIATALEKVPADRFSTAAEFAAALATGPTGTVGRHALSVTRRLWHERAAWLLLLLTSAVIGAYGWLHGRADAPTRAGSTRTSILLPDSLPLTFVGAATLGIGRPAFAVSPDGRKLVYVALHRGTPVLVLRPIDAYEVRTLEGTAGAYGPFFSLDGAWVGFFVGNLLKKVSVEGGSPVTLAEVTNAMGADCGPDDWIVVGAQEGGTLVRVPASGGSEILGSVKGEFAFYNWPGFLPDGHSIVSTSWTQEPVVVDLASPEAIRLGMNGLGARYVASGHLVYGQDGALLAAPFDTRGRRLMGTAVPMISGVRTEVYGNAQWTVSAEGTLVFAPGRQVELGRLAWVDASGMAEPLPMSERRFGTFELSPDGTRYAIEVWAQTVDIWVYDIAGGRTLRITRDGNNFGPIWSPDGTSIAFMSDRDGPVRAFLAAADGGGAVRRIDLQPAPGHQAMAGQPVGRRHLLVVR